MTQVPTVPAVLQNFYNAQGQINNAKAELAAAWQDVQEGDCSGAQNEFAALAATLSWLSANFPGSTSAKSAAAGEGVANNDRQVARSPFGIIFMADEPGRYYTPLLNDINAISLKGLATGVKFS